MDRKLKRLRDAWSDLHIALLKLDLPDNVKEKMRKMSVAVNSILSKRSWSRMVDSVDFKVVDAEEVCRYCPYNNVCELKGNVTKILIVEIETDRELETIYIPMTVCMRYRGKYEDYFPTGEVRR